MSLKVYPISPIWNSRSFPEGLYEPCWPWHCELIQLISTYVHNGIVYELLSKHTQDFSGRDWMAWWLGFIEKYCLLVPLILTYPDNSITELFAIYWTSCSLQISAVMTLGWLSRPLIKKNKQRGLMTDSRTNCWKTTDTDQCAWYLLTYTCVLICIKQIFKAYLIMFGRVTLHCSILSSLHWITSTIKILI